MSDSIVHSSIHAGSRALAQGLACRLGLRPAPFPPVERPDAALGVAPTSERRHRRPELPVVILSRRVAHISELDGRLVLCGCRDEADAPAAASSAAIADELGLPLLLVHVLSTERTLVPGAAAVPGIWGFTIEDTVRANEMLDRVVDAAGIANADVGRRVVRGVPGLTLAAFGHSEDAALVVVGASARSWVSRAFEPSVTRHLGRRCDRPVMVCPRHPAPAMRLREALGCRARYAWEGP
jgi:nucleotide-binding universal stress UspA family protein